jgi:predicted DNA-binding transcriptional regulator AlpA
MVFVTVEDMANHGNKLEPLLTKRDVSRWLQISERGVESLTEAGKLPAIKVGNKILRWRRADIEQQFRRRGA